MTIRDLVDHFRAQSGAFTDVLRDLVLSPTPTGDTDSIHRFINDLEHRFSRFGPEVSRIRTESGDILHLTVDGQRPGSVVLLAHADTVSVSPGPPQVRIEGDCMFGPGAYDMKNGIALFDFVLRAFEDLDTPPPHHVQLIFTPDEETGSHGSIAYLKKACADALAVILPEPSCPDGGVKIRRKGVASIHASVIGRAAHSGIEPEKGKDANRGLTALIRMIDSIAANHPGVHFNPGIVSGGRAVNVVSPACTLEGEMRCFSNERLQAAVEAVGRIDHIGDMGVRMAVRMEHPALEHTEKNARLFKAARRIAGELGVTLTSCETGGASDGSDLSASGIPVLDGVGMRGGGAHTADEFVDLSDFPFRAALFFRLIQEMHDD